MKFRTYSQAGLDILELYREATTDTSAMRVVKMNALYAELCPWEVVIVNGSDDLFLDQIKADPVGELLPELFRAWNEIALSLPDSDLLAPWRVVERLGTAIYHRPWLRKFNFGPRPRFFILASGLAPLLRDIGLLSLTYQLEQGRLPLHAAGVIRNNGLYLFLGHSGAGKSTAAYYSQLVGGEVLDEDQVLVRPHNNGRFTANAWGYSLQTSEVPVRGIFSLVQEQTDRLLPLSQARVARLLLSGYSDITGLSLPNAILPQLLNAIVPLARHIPGFELQFRKSPDFWNLIDSKLPI